jgi:hypothetical protein
MSFHEMIMNIPKQENEEMLCGIKVRPCIAIEDHLHHINIHEAALIDALLSDNPNLKYIKALEAHIKDHITKSRKFNKMLAKIRLQLETS